MWIPLIIAVGVIVFGIWSVLQIESSRWQAADRRRSNWIVMMLCFGPLAVLLFYGTVRQHLLYPERYEVIDGASAADR